MTAEPAQALLEAMGAVARAFEADDAVAASALLDDVLRAQVALRDAGVRLAPPALDRVRDLQGAMTSAALAAARRLDERLATAGAARRAVGAYGGR